MFTKQQQRQLAEFLISNRAPLALIEPLATPSALRIKDADGKPPLWLALEHHNDPAVIALIICRHPSALVSVVGGEVIWLWFMRLLPADNRFSNHDDILDLLVCSYNAFKRRRFPRLVELCGTSDALLALVAAHSEDDLSLDVLCYRESWDKVLARIKQLPTQATVDELFSLNELGVTAFTLASANDTLVAVLESMLDLCELDAEKRNILDIADIHLRLPLHNIAEFHPDPAAIKLLVSIYPHALLVRDHVDDTPQDCAIESNSPTVVSLVQAVTTSYEHRDYPALITLCGPSPVLIRLHSLSLRTAAVLCLERIKTTAVPPPACTTTAAVIYLLSGLTTRRASGARSSPTSASPMTAVSD